MMAIKADVDRQVESDHSALERLLARIEDRRIRRKVQKLLQLGEDAVRALGELDAALYFRRDGEQQLQIVSDAVLSHLRRLLQYVGMVVPAADREASGDDALELDFGDGSVAHVPALPARPPVAERGRGTDADKWTALCCDLAALQYGLSSELKEYEARFARALRADNGELALREINDATTRLMDGVFAVMTTVYEWFLGYAEPERMVPGHRDTLSKALLVRRALANLRRTVRDHNRQLQARPAEAPYRAIALALGQFVDGDVFAYLRSDTRRDLVQLRATLANGSALANRLDCEGFDKYLDSLSFVSQRGVLIKHDTDLMQSIAGDLERAIKFARQLPELVGEVIEQAFLKAERLVGLSDEIDDLVQQWSSLAAETRTDLAYARRLLELVRPRTN